MVQLQLANFRAEGLNTECSELQATGLGFRLHTECLELQAKRLGFRLHTECSELQAKREASAALQAETEMLKDSVLVFSLLQAKLEASAALQTETEKLKNSVLAAQEKMAELQQQKAAAHDQVAGLLLEKETLEHDKQQMHAALAALQAETDALKTAAQKSDDMIVDVQHARLQACILLLI